MQHDDSHHDESADECARQQQLTSTGHMELAEIDEYEEGVSDEDSRSSPARSHAALALASMFRQKPSTGKYPNPHEPLVRPHVLSS